jgi:ABC-type antimicrobial peptide transport system permease subunit
MQVKYNDNQDSTSVWLNLVDEQYLPLHKHEFVAGRNFTPKADGVETEVIVNEQLLARLQFNADPKKVLGEQLGVDDKKLVIVGVIKDFHYGTMEDRIEPMIFRYSNEPGGYLNVNIESNNITSTMEKIAAAWSKVHASQLDGSFYDDQIEMAYSQFSVMVKVIGFLGFLAIVIASMGLFGMVVFTTETRLKEISIRKVLGAGEGGLILLLSKGFLFLLALSASIAVPLTYFFFDQVVLTNFAYHSPIGLGGILIGAGSIMALAFVMIGSQTLRAARSNPASVLKVE